MKLISFEDLPTTQKGKLGEMAVANYLKSIGIVSYMPLNGLAHPFDLLCATNDKKKIFIAECKSKAARTYYPDTGINLTSYQDYKNIAVKYGIDVWLFFVDEDRKKIYGNLLSELDKPRQVPHKGILLNYPKNENYNGRIIRYFPLEAMIDIIKINDELVEELKKLSARNYEYINS
jgi:hypothetical protein